MNEQDHILIVDYIDGQLSAADKAAFEQRLATDKGLQEALAEQKMLVGAVSVFGKLNLKSQLNVIHTQAVDGNAFKKYKPSNLPAASAGFSIGSFIGGFIFVAFICAIISIILIYTDKFPIEHPIIDKIKKELISIDSLEYEHYDPTNPMFIESYAVETVYHEIVVPAGSGIGNGTIIYEDELDGKTIEEYTQEISVDEEIESLIPDESYPVETVYHQITVPAGIDIESEIIINSEDLDGKSVEEYLESQGE